MPCDYVSVTRFAVTDIRTLEKALKHLGLEGQYQVSEKDGITTITHNNFKITMEDGKDAVLENWGMSLKWQNDLKQRYAVETSKKAARKMGFFAKEKQVGDKIQLVMTK